MAKRYEHPFAERQDSKITFKCTKMEKRKFDEIVTYLHKSKTRIMIDHINDLYRKMLEG